MDDNVVKTCVICKAEKRTDIFPVKKYLECKACNFKRVLK